MEVTHRLQVQEAIETGHTLDDGGCQPDPGGHEGQCRTREPAGVLLDFTQDLHQGFTACAVAAQYTGHGGAQAGFIGAVDGHGVMADIGAQEAQCRVNPKGQVRTVAKTAMLLPIGVCVEAFWCSGAAVHGPRPHNGQHMEIAAVAKRPPPTILTKP